MATTKLTCHKEWSFASNYVSVLDSLKKSYFDVVFGSFFPGSILKCSTERNSWKYVKNKLLKRREEKLLKEINRNRVLYE